MEANGIDVIQVDRSTNTDAVAKTKAGENSATTSHLAYLLVRNQGIAISFFLLRTINKTLIAISQPTLKTTLLGFTDVITLSRVGYLLYMLRNANVQVLCATLKEDYQVKYRINLFTSQSSFFQEVANTFRKETIVTTLIFLVDLVKRITN